MIRVISTRGSRDVLSKVLSEQGAAVAGDGEGFDRIFASSRLDIESAATAGTAAGVPRDQLPFEELGSGQTRFTVDAVTLDSHVVIANAFELTTTDGLLAWCQLDSDRMGAVHAAASQMTDRTGPISVEFDHNLAITAVRSSFTLPGLDPDASFASIGVSPQHLLAESLLRPLEFSRRFGRERKGLGLHLGATNIPVSPVSPGLGAVRRLPGFHSLSSDIDGFRWVVFVHRDAVTVQHSLDLARAFAASGQLSADGFSLFGYSAMHGREEALSEWN